MRIILDAGHGGDKPGAVYDGIEEKSVVLDIVLKTGDFLREMGHFVIFTRDKDEGMTLTNRLRMISEFKPEAFVSVHANASKNPSIRGVETYYRDEGDILLAQTLHNHISTYFGMKNRGLHRDIDVLGKRLTVLNDYVVPSCLVEIGYLSNDDNRDYITNNKETIAEILSIALNDYSKQIVDA